MSRCCVVIVCFSMMLVACGDGSMPLGDPRGGAGAGGAGNSGSGGSATGGSGGSFVGMADCSGGALSAPLAGCAPAVAASTGDVHQDCVNRINQLRWECQCLPPLERWTEAEACANQQAEYDSTRGAHAGFSDGICSPDGFGQNECPGWNSNAQVIGGCLQAMWDEGPGPFSTSGHYINMTNPRHSRVACGFYTTPGGLVWSVQNFE